MPWWFFAALPYPLALLGLAGLLMVAFWLNTEFGWPFSRRR